MNNHPVYEAVLFFRTKKRIDPKAPPKTGVESMGEFNTHERANEVATYSYENNKHAYVGYGVLVKWGE